MRCGPVTLAALALLASLSPTAAKERQPALKAKCVDHPSEPERRVCRQIDESALTGLGRSATWRIWVEGKGKPIQVRLHNNSPEVVQLEGGNDQIVSLGGRHDEIRREVTAIGPGTAGLEARPYAPAPEREATAIAAALAPQLARIEARFIERRAKLSPSSDGSSPAVTELLDATETELLKALSFQELAALRDYVQEKFREARSALNARGTNRKVYFLPSPASRTAFASLRLSQRAPSSSTTGQTADSMLGQLLKMLHRLSAMASENDLVTNLCVTSAPKPGVRFRMRPQSFDDWLDESTNTEFRNVYRGLYIFSMGKGSKSVSCIHPEKEECGPINLVDNSRPIFHCDLDARVCQRQDGPLPPGVCRGN